MEFTITCFGEFNARGCADVIYRMWHKSLL